MSFVSNIFKRWVTQPRKHSLLCVVTCISSVILLVVKCLPEAFKRMGSLFDNPTGYLELDLHVCEYTFLFIIIIYFVSVLLAEFPRWKYKCKQRILLRSILKVVSDVLELVVVAYYFLAAVFCILYAIEDVIPSGYSNLQNMAIVHLILVILTRIIRQNFNWIDKYTTCKQCTGYTDTNGELIRNGDTVSFDGQAYEVDYCDNDWVLIPETCEQNTVKLLEVFQDEKKPDRLFRLLGRIQSRAEYSCDGPHTCKKGEKNMRNKKMAKESIHFPDEFDYGKEYNKYRKIDVVDQRKKDDKLENYSIWSARIKSIYDGLYTEEKRIQLKWALRNHQKRQSRCKDVLYYICLAMVVLLIGYSIPYISSVVRGTDNSKAEYSVKMSQIDGEVQYKVEKDSSNSILSSPYIEFAVAAILVVAAEIIMISTIVQEDFKAEFDEEVLLVLDGIKQEDIKSEDTKDDGNKSQDEGINRNENT